MAAALTDAPIYSWPTYSKPKYAFVGTWPKSKWYREDEYDQLAELRRDDNDLLEIISALLTKRMLN